MPAAAPTYVPLRRHRRTPPARHPAPVPVRRLRARVRRHERLQGGAQLLPSFRRPEEASPGTVKLDSERAPESPSGVVRLGTVVVHEDRVVAAIAEQRAAELPDLGRCLHPAGRCRIELTKLLEPPILVHCQECRHPWQWPCRQRCSSVCAPSVRRALGDRSRRCGVL